MDVRLPRLGEGADSGSVVTVFVKEGDHIKADQTILELENEKAVASIPSPAAGKITKIHVEPGQKVSVGQVILSLAEEAADNSQPAKEKPVESEEQKSRKDAAAPPVSSAA